jgi:peptidoglycan/xylan/chitin deacetylase (PgdA/CDA1 family)
MIVVRVAAVARVTIGHPVLRVAMLVRGMGLWVWGLALFSLRATGFGRVSPPQASIVTRIPILEYHVVRAKASGEFIISRDDFRRDLRLLYDRGYRPITVAQLLDKDFRDVPVGMSPVVFTFDDASPEQFSYVEKNGKLEIDSTSVIGMWLEFQKTHPDWKSRATFCVLSGARAGHAFFGDGPQWNGQHAAWRFRKLRWLVDNGFELCNHTLWHAQLNTSSDAVVQEQIARGQLAIDSAVPGYKVRTFALPQGLWPKNRELAWRGSWTDPKSGKAISYENETVLEVLGGPVPNPFDATFEHRRLTRFIVSRGNLKPLLDKLEATGTRFKRSGT